MFTEEVRFKNGQVLDRNFDTYELPRFSWMPKVETVIVDSPDLPAQGGSDDQHRARRTREGYDALRALMSDKDSLAGVHRGPVSPNGVGTAAS